MELWDMRIIVYQPVQGVSSPSGTKIWTVVVETARQMAGEKKERPGGHSYMDMCIAP